MDAELSLPILMKIARMDAASWRSEETNENLLPEIVQRELLLLADSIPQYSGSNCLLHDVGNILERTMAMLAALARNVVEGPQIRHYVDERIKEMEKVDDLSELNPLFYMDEKHRQLKILAGELEEAAQSVTTLWSATQDPPEMFRTSYRDFPPPSDPPTTGYTNGYTNGYIPPEKMDSPTAEVPQDFTGFRSPIQEPDSETNSSPMLTPATTAGTQEAISEPKRSPSSEELTGPDLIRELLTSLSVRGTGRYTCPYLHDCRKGGVKYEELVVFERNSAFRAHLQKHEKQYMCTLPGCTAKGGFARIDQLRRHQTMVPHTKRESYS